MPGTIPEAFAAAVAQFSDRPALCFKRAGRYHTPTYRELDEAVTRFAAALLLRGLQRGERVGILAYNGPVWVIADLGTMRAGGITVPIHTTFSPALICHVLEHAGCRTLVVCGARNLEKVGRMTPELSPFPHLIVADADGVAVHHSSVQLWDDFLNNSGMPDPVLRKPDDPASIVYTSGTTGLPKGVVLTHRNFLSNAAAATSAVPVYPTDTFLSFLPLSHVLERTAGYYAPITHGAQIAFAESYATLKDNLREVRPTILVAVPRIFEKFHDALWAKVHAGSRLQRRIFQWALRQRRGSFSHRVADAIVFKKIRRALGGRLRLSISGGAALHPPLAKFFDRLGVLILEGYGLTETAPVVSVNTAAARKIGSVGKPVFGVSVKIAPDKEILVRGENVCAGYWQDDAATVELFNPEQWLHTGDLGFLDADGFLFIIGRAKEMLVLANGKNVWPQVVENALNGDAYIAQSMVIGDRRPYVAALVAPDWTALKEEATRQGWPVDSTALLSHPAVCDFFKQRITNALAHLPDYEQVRRFALIPREFSAEQDEVTPTQKLRRTVIERHFAKEIETLYRK